MLNFYFSLIDEAYQGLFEEYYLKYRKRMVYVAYKFLNDEMEAEDAVHDAFIGIARNIGKISKFENKKDVRYYILSSAKNAAFNIRRKKVAEPMDIDEIFDLPDIHSADIYEQLEFNEIVKVIEKLAPIYRKPLYCHFVLGLSIEETAKFLNKKKDTIKQQLVRGKKLLLHSMEEILNERMDE